jgi:trehalose/maltose hydrolase-like predicted phosphorylase
MSERDENGGQLHQHLGGLAARITTLESHSPSGDGHEYGTLRARLDGVQELLTERDRRVTERFESSEKSVKTALDAAEKAVNAALVAAEKAVNKAEAAAEKRFDSVNEFRGQLKDQAETFMTKLEANATSKQHRELIDANKEDVGTLRAEVLKLASRQTYDDSSDSTVRELLNIWAPVLVAGAGIIVTIIVLLHK